MIGTGYILNKPETRQALAEVPDAVERAVEEGDGVAEVRVGAEDLEGAEQRLVDEVRGEYNTTITLAPPNSSTKGWII